MNRTDKEWKLNYNWKKNPIYYMQSINFYTKEYQIKDLWEHKYIGTTEKNTTYNIPAHGVLLVLLTPKNK